MIVVSACLAGEMCRYDGRNALVAEVAEMVREGKALAVCPEVLGGLPTPRECAELQGDKIVSQSGRDVTQEYQTGCRRALEIAIQAGCRQAVLKDKSPTCGCGRIYDGSFCGKLVAGDGVFCRMLKEAGIIVQGV